MARKPDHIDEYLLADYLAGDLSPAQRDRCSAYLAGDGSARELLSMAGEAMDAAELPGTKSDTLRDSKPDSQSMAQEDLWKRREGVRSRPPFQTRHMRMLMSLTVVLAILTSLFGVALVFHLSENGLPDQANTIPTIDVGWTPILDSDHFGVAWSGVDRAATYVVIVMDPSSERLVARIETSSTSINELFGQPNNEVKLRNNEIPRSGEILDLWISAFDMRGQLLRRSDRIPFLVKS